MGHRKTTSNQTQKRYGKQVNEKAKIAKETRPSFWRKGWNCLLAISTTCSLVVAWQLIRPELSVHQPPPVVGPNPFEGLWTLTNTGWVPVVKMTPILRPRLIRAEGASTLSGGGRMTSTTLAVNKLHPSESTSFAFPVALASRRSITARSQGDAGSLCRLLNIGF